MIKEVMPESCACGIDVFLHKDGEQYSKYEDLAGIIQHTKLRCEINQVLGTKLNRVETELNKIKEMLNL